MVEEAEKDGILDARAPTLIEPSSGNTGIGLALVCRLKGYQLKVVLATNVSIERRQLLESWGAEIIESPGSEGSNGAVRRARALADEHPEWVFLYQYANPANPRAHYEGTGPEIWRDCPEVTHFVAGLGHVGHPARGGPVPEGAEPRHQGLAIEPPAGEMVDGLRNLDDGYIPPIFLDNDGAELLDGKTHRAAPRVDRVDPPADRGRASSPGSPRAPSWPARSRRRPRLESGVDRDGRAATAGGSTSPPGPGPTTSTWSRPGPSRSPTSDGAGRRRRPGPPAARRTPGPATGVRPAASPAGRGGAARTPATRSS